MIDRFLNLLRRKGLRSEYRNFTLAAQRSYAPYRIGEWSYGKPTVIQWDRHTSLSIGRFCSIAEGATIILGGEHSSDWITTYPFNALFLEGAQLPRHPGTKGDVVIGHDVWIGRDAMILSGVTIGNGAIAGASSVVTKDVPPYAIVAGNPARHIRFRFAEAEIAQLQQIAWWDWPFDQIRAAWPLLMSPDIQAFIARYGKHD